MVFLLLLFGLVVGAGALAAAAERWQVALQREREADLLFRGVAIKDAIESYQARVVQGRREFPSRLEDLVEDRRDNSVRYHLRRLYADPFTGRVDWVEIRGEDGRLLGVSSRSRVSAYRRHGLPVSVDAAALHPRASLSVGDWRFVAAAREADPPSQ